MQTRRSRRFSQRSLRSESPLTELESEDQQQPRSTPRKRRRKTDVVEPVIYDIPPVESKTTTYRGLVSYSFSYYQLNTQLPFLGRLGYVRTPLLVLLLDQPLVLN